MIYCNKSESIPASVSWIIQELYTCTRQGICIAILRPSWSFYIPGRPNDRADTIAEALTEPNVSYGIPISRHYGIGSSSTKLSWRCYVSTTAWWPGYEGEHYLAVVLIFASTTNKWHGMYISHASNTTLEVTAALLQQPGLSCGFPWPHPRTLHAI